MLQENDIAKRIVHSAFHIHKRLGPGLFESVYEEILWYELCRQGFQVNRQKEIPVIWEGRLMDLSFRADLIVDKKVLVEIKSVEFTAPIHFKQVLTYLKLTDIRLGLLINFNELLIKDGIHRIVNGL